MDDRVQTPVQDIDRATVTHESDDVSRESLMLTGINFLTHVHRILYKFTNTAPFTVVDGDNFTPQVTPNSVCV